MGNIPFLWHWKHYVVWFCPSYCGWSIETWISQGIASHSHYDTWLPYPGKKTQMVCFRLHQDGENLRNGSKALEGRTQAYVGRTLQSLARSLRVARASRPARLALRSIAHRDRWDIIFPIPLTRKFKLNAHQLRGENKLRPSWIAPGGTKRRVPQGPDSGTLQRRVNLRFAPKGGLRCRTQRGRTTALEAAEGRRIVALKDRWVYPE